MLQNPVRSTLNSALNLIRNTWCLARHRHRDRWTRRSTSPCLLHLDSDSRGCNCPGHALPPTPADAIVLAMLCLQLLRMQLSWPCFASNSSGCNCPGHALPPTPVDAIVLAMLCLQLLRMQLSWPCLASDSLGCNCPGHALPLTPADAIVLDMSE